MEDDRLCIRMKEKLSLCLSDHHAMKVYWGVKVWLHAFLTPAPHRMSGQFHALAASSPGKEALVPTG